MAGLSASRVSSPDATVLLSPKGLRNIHVKEDGFTFVVGPRISRCPIYQAEFLSPRVSALRQIDDTITEMNVDVKDGSGFFGEFMKLCPGHALSVSSKD
jgi:hypothetical protein